MPIKMKKYFYFPILALTVFSSCTENINVSLPNSDKQIVIEGTIENGKRPEVIITKTISLFSSIGNVNPADFFILDARVYVSNGTVTDTLKLTVDSSSSMGLVYKGNTLLGTIGQRYSLTVISNGNTYTATTTIPQLVALDSVWWQAKPRSDTLGFAYAHMSDPVGLGNNYRWYAKRPTKDRRFIAPLGATFDDKLIDGKKFDFAYTKGYDPTDNKNSELADPDIERNCYRKRDTICIKFCTIDRASKDFYTTFEAALSNNGNPFSSPVTILKNIEGGALGVWAGMGATYDTILPSL